jgi:hypothetical protein
MLYLSYIHKIVLLPDIVTLGTSNTGIARAEVPTEAANAVMQNNRGIVLGNSTIFKS